MTTKQEQEELDYLYEVAATVDDGDIDSLPPLQLRRSNAITIPNDPETQHRTCEVVSYASELSEEVFDDIREHVLSRIDEFIKSSSDYVIQRTEQALFNYEDKVDKLKQVINEYERIKSEYGYENLSFFVAIALDREREPDDIPINVKISQFANVILLCKEKNMYEKEKNFLAEVIDKYNNVKN